MSSAPYMYENGTPDQMRLDLLNRAFNPQSLQTLRRLGLGSDRKQILELACGQGQMTCAIAEETPDGIVVGVDISEEQLAIARQRAASRGLANAHFVNASIFELPRLIDSLTFEFRPDLIYCRFLLVHFDNEQAFELIQLVHEFAASGCRVFHDELDLNSTPVACESLRRFFDLYHQLEDQMHNDLSFGPKIPGHMIELGYEDVGSRLFHPDFADASPEYFVLDLERSRPTFDEYGVIDSAGADRLRAQLRADAAAGHAMTFSGFHSWGTRRA